MIVNCLSKFFNFEKQDLHGLKINKNIVTILIYKIFFHLREAFAITSVPEVFFTNILEKNVIITR